MKKMLALSLFILIFQMTHGYATVANPWLPMSMQCGEFSDNTCYARQAQYLANYGGRAPAMTQLFDSMNPILNHTRFSQVGRAPAVFEAGSFFSVSNGLPGSTYTGPLAISNSTRFNNGIAESFSALPTRGVSRAPAVISIGGASR